MKKDFVAAGNKNIAHSALYLLLLSSKVILIQHLFIYFEILFHFTVHRDQMRGMAVAHVQSQSSTTRQRLPSKTYDEGKVSVRDVTISWLILNASVIIIILYSEISLQPGIS